MSQKESATISHPYDTLQYNIPRKWAEALVSTALQGVPIEWATQDWPVEEVESFIETIACGATLTKEDPVTKEYKEIEVTISPLYEDRSDEWKRGAADAWVQDSPESVDPEYMAGWEYTWAIALINKSEP